MGFNPFDPAGLMGGGGGDPLGLMGGGDEGGGGGGPGLSIGGGPSEETQDKANEFDAKKAYGFGGGAPDSTFNAMRKQQMGMGGSSQGG